MDVISESVAHFRQSRYTQSYKSEEVIFDIYPGMSRIVTYGCLMRNAEGSALIQILDCILFPTITPQSQPLMYTWSLQCIAFFSNCKLLPVVRDEPINIQFWLHSVGSRLQS